MSFIINPFIENAAPPPAFLHDNFNTLDLATNWNLFNGNGGSCIADVHTPSTFTFFGNMFRVAVGSGSGVFEGIYSKTPFDLRDRYVTIYAYQWSLSNVNCVLGIYDPTMSKRMEATLAAGTLYLAIPGAAGTNTGGVSNVYIKFGFRTSDSKFYFESSTDDITYTPLYSATSTLDPSSVIFVAYPYSFGGSGQEFYVDKFNSNIPV